MFKRFFILSSTILIGLLCLAFKTDASHVPPHLADLRLLLDDITPPSTGYISGPIQVIWKKSSKSPAVCNTDSSGLVNALLCHTYGFTPKDFEKWMGTSRPLTGNFYQHILMDSRFQRITAITEVQPGDFLAIAYTGQDDSSDGTGYMAIIDKKPNYVHQMEPHIPNLQQWTMNVIDCAMLGHGEKDTRAHHDHMYSGLGRGALRIFVDGQGHIQGYTWTRENGPFHPISERHIVIGRFIH